MQGGKQGPPTLLEDAYHVPQIANHLPTVFKV
jgi:hypothetical protein